VRLLHGHMDAFLIIDQRIVRVCLHHHNTKRGKGAAGSDQAGQPSCPLSEASPFPYFQGTIEKVFAALKNLPFIPFGG
jgi:hypothetical protein